MSTIDWFCRDCYIIHKTSDCIDRTKDNICPVCNTPFDNYKKLNKHITRCKTCSNIYFKNLQYKQHQAFVEAHTKYVQEKLSTL